MALMATVAVWVAEEGQCWQCRGTGHVAKGNATCGVCHGYSHRSNVCFKVDHPIGAWDSRFIERLVDLNDSAFENWALKLLVKPMFYEATWPIPPATIVEMLP